MIPKHTFPKLAWLVLLSLSMASASIAQVETAPASTLTPRQAVQIINQDKNWAQVVAALTVATGDAGSRQNVNYFFANQLAGRVEDYHKNFDNFEDQKLKDDGWGNYFFPGLNPLLQAIAVTDDPEEFAVFETIAKCGVFYPQGVAESFSEYLREGSPMEGWFLDYVAQNIKLEWAGPILLRMHSRPAFDCLIKILDAHPGQTFDFEQFWNRYDPRLVTLYLRAIDGRLGAQDPAGITTLFLAADAGSGPNMPLEAADPVVYPQIRRFIEEAEKYNFPPSPIQAYARQDLIDAKAKLRALEIQHPPPPLRDVPDDPGAIPFVPVAINADLYHFESNMNPPFPWQAEILIVITVLFTGWWFWTEWKRFRK